MNFRPPKECLFHLPFGKELKNHSSRFSRSLAGLLESRRPSIFGWMTGWLSQIDLVFPRTFANAQRISDYYFDETCIYEASTIFFTSCMGPLDMGQLYST